jgi:hypothetical protein
MRNTLFRRWAELRHALRLRHGEPRCSVSAPPGASAVRSCWKELERVERRRRADRVVQVERDAIEALLRLAHELHAVVHQNPQLRVVEHAVVDGLEMLLRHRDHIGVDLDHRQALHRGVLERLLGRAAVAAADDEDLLRRRVRCERRVDEVLVVDELLLLGGHVEPVEAEELAVVRRVVDLHLLEARLPLAELPVARM